MIYDKIYFDNDDKNRETAKWTEQAATWADNIN